MPKTICIDTNVLLRAILSGESTQKEQSIALLEAIKADRYRGVIPGIVLAEVAWVLSTAYGLEKLELVDILNSIVAMPNTKVVDSYQWGLATELFNLLNIKFVDAAILSLVGMNNGLHSDSMILATFDKKLLNLEIKGIGVVSPADL